MARRPRPQLQHRLAEAAQKLAQTEKLAARGLRLRNRIITAVGVVALILAVLAGVFALNSNRNAGIADEQRNAAQSAQSTALAERTLADKAAAISFSVLTALSRLAGLSIILTSKSEARCWKIPAGKRFGMPKRDTP